MFFVPIGNVFRTVLCGFGSLHQNSFAIDDIDAISWLINTQASQGEDVRCPRFATAPLHVKPESVIRLLHANKPAFSHLFHRFSVTMERFR